MLKTPIYTRKAIDRWRVVHRDKHLQQARQSSKRYYEKVSVWKSVVRQFRKIDPSFFY